MGAPKRDEEMLKPQIEALERRYGKDGRIKVVRVFGDGDESAGEIKGRIEKSMLEKYLGDARQTGTKVFVCGPEGMQKAVVGNGWSVGGWLGELGWKKEQVTVF